MAQLVEDLQQALGASWPSIIAARQAAMAQHATLGELLKGCGTSDAAIVAFGSLARKELTGSSDLDWTLLVDGPAKRDQWPSVHQVHTKLAELKIVPPNPTGAFGSMAFSHELVHRIGGDTDTNRITTQRVLLLLESVPIGPVSSVEVHSRVVRSVLDCYLGDDVVVRERVPHLLLNDVVRYWRTMTVDFAAKARERGNKGWALRNLKLRTSRKLIFAAGLVMCLDRVDGASASAAPSADGDDARADLLEQLVAKAGETPLDTLAGATLGRPEMAPLARPVFDAYDLFLGLLNDPSRRAHLEKLLREDAERDPGWMAARQIARDFGQAIESFFFDPPSVYAGAIRKYGVF
jgi:predicted nucleotidyltransferase